MRTLCWLSLSTMLLISCPARSSSGPEWSASPHGSLERAGTLLNYTHAGASVTLSVSEPLPYRIVCSSQPALLTTIDAALLPTTWAAAQQPCAYPGMLPVVSMPPLVALQQLPASSDAVATDLLLLGPDGTAIWRDTGCELLWPAAAEQDYLEQPATAYVLRASIGDLVFPYGSTPELLAISLPGGEPTWQLDLKAAGPVAGVELLCVSDTWGLLSLQYDYQIYELLRFQLSDGSLGPRWRLSGQLAARIVYPGALEEPLDVKLRGQRLSVAVIAGSQKYETWDFDLSAGKLHKYPLHTPPAIRREENSAAVGGDAAPDPAEPPFPQGLLPAASGEQWSIPALVSSQGEVLVIDADGARWISLPD